MADENDLRSNPRLQFCYFGLHRVLLRYRRATVVGWFIVLIGVAGIPLGWEFGRNHGLIDLILAVCTIVGGLVVVQLSVASLSTYVSVRFPAGDPASTPALPAESFDEIDHLMKEVDDGGWQEAYAAIGKLKELGQRFGFPPLE